MKKIYIPIPINISNIVFHRIVTLTLHNLHAISSFENKVWPILVCRKLQSYLLVLSSSVFCHIFDTNLDQE